MNQFLTELDGVSGLNGVVVLAATSRPDLIDPALLRPGRLDRLLLCDFPGRDARLEILERSVRDCAGFEDQRAFNEDQLGLHAVAKATEGFSGADLRALATDAHMHAVHRAMESETPVMTRGRLSRRLSRGRTWLGRRGRRGGRCRLGSASGWMPCLRSFAGVGWGPAGRRRRARVPSAYPWRETVLEQTEQVLKSPTHQ